MVYSCICLYFTIMQNKTYVITKLKNEMYDMHICHFGDLLPGKAFLTLRVIEK